MTEFKVGDKVRVTDGPAALEEYGADTNTGDTGVIEDTATDKLCPLKVRFDHDGDYWWLHEKHLELVTSADDPVNHPAHYTSHPSGVECIQITEHMSFPCGNAIKYIWRADLKGDGVEDLKKAKWYIEREIAKREAG